MEAHHRSRHAIGSPAAFRPQAKEYALHPLEKALAIVVIALLVFLPWALGGMKLWAQQIAFALAALAFVLALIPRTYDDRYHAGGNLRLYMWPKLLRFPVFWLGLAYFAIILIQIANPAWTFRSSAAGWWLEPRDYIEWLPRGVEGTPIKMNGWRTLLIQGGAWLVVCALWVGILRRRTSLLLITAIAVNGAVVALSILIQQSTNSTHFLLMWDPPSRYFSGPFYYKNHAGAYILVILSICVGLAWFHKDKAVIHQRRSNPGPLFLLCSILVAIALLLTFSRAASLLGGALLLCVASLYIWNSVFRAKLRSLQYFVGVGTLIIFSVSAFALYIPHAQSVLGNFDKLLGEDKQFSIGWRHKAILATLDMSKDSPIWGHGSGGFRYVFPIYQQNYKEIWTGFEWSEGKIVERRLFWEHTHSDLIEFFSETGVAGVSILIGAVIAIVCAWRRSRIQEMPSLVVMFLGVIFLAFHSLVDFPTHNPAILFTAAAVCAVTLRWAQLSRR